LTQQQLTTNTQNEAQSQITRPTYLPFLTLNGQNMSSLSQQQQLATNLSILQRYGQLSPQMIPSSVSPQNMLFLNSSISQNSNLNNTLSPSNMSSSLSQTRSPFNTLTQKPTPDLTNPQRIPSFALNNFPFFSSNGSLLIPTSTNVNQNQLLRPMFKPMLIPTNQQSLNYLQFLGNSGILNQS
jgi:hypothetical protein